MKELIDYLYQAIQDIDEQLNQIRAAEIALTERIAEARFMLHLMEQKLEGEE